jgi:hypothetical protein
MRVELIGRPRVDNVHAEDALAGVGAIEAHPVGVEALREMLVWLERDADIGEPRPALEVVDWIVVNRRADAAPNIELEPVEYLHPSEKVDVLTDVVPRALPGFVSAGP